MVAASSNKGQCFFIIANSDRIKVSILQNQTGHLLGRFRLQAMAKCRQRLDRKLHYRASLNGTGVNFLTKI